MITRKELLKAFGITRKTLDHYNDIKLLCPANSDEIKAAKGTGLKPEWSYKDDDYSRLQIIQVLRAVDYEPSEIKKLLDEKELTEILEMSLDKLNQKKKSIDGMIGIIKRIQLAQQIPEHTLEALAGIDIKQLMGDKDYATFLEEAKNTLSDSSVLDDDESKMPIHLITLMYLMVEYRESGFDSEATQSVVRQAYLYFIDCCNFEEVLSEEELRSKEFIQEVVLNPEFIHTFCEMILEIFDGVIGEQIDARCGPGASKFITDAINYFEKAM